MAIGIVREDPQKLAVGLVAHQTAHVLRVLIGDFARHRKVLVFFLPQPSNV